MADDPYKVLGVPEGAGDISIKRAYRREMFKLHPDTGTGDTEAIQKIREAYELLSDKDKRTKYDKVRKIFEDDEKDKKDRESRPSTIFSGGSSGSAWFSGSSGMSFTAGNNISQGSIVYASGSLGYGFGYSSSVGFTQPAIIRASVTYTPNTTTPMIKIGDIVYYTQGGGITQKAQSGAMQFQVVAIRQQYSFHGLQSYELDLQQTP